MDNSPHTHSEVDTPGTSSGVNNHFKNDSSHTRGVHAVTSVERSVRKTLFRIYLLGGIFAFVCCLGVFIGSFFVYRQATYIDPVTPDYSALNEESDTYWTDRIRIDIETAQNSEGAEQVRDRRLRTFVSRTVAEAMQISPPFARAQVVTSIATMLAQNDIDITLDHQLRQLGDTPLTVSLRARTLISQSLMFLRKGRGSAAQQTLLHYNQLVSEGDLKLNSPLNEESFFGAATISHCLGDAESLKELFERQMAATTALGIDQRMKAYRLIAGEQVRTGMVLKALETAKQITNPVEQARAWALILQYAARPPRIVPVEPIMLELLDDPQAEPPQYLAFAERIADEIFQHLAANNNINAQTALLQRIAGSRLMYDAELYQTFRKSLTENEVLHDQVKQSVLKLLDDPESPTIRTALDMPPRAEPALIPLDSAMDDWTTSDEPIYIEAVDIDPTPLRTLNDQQWIEALLAIAQSYQSVRRFQDADRILKQAFNAVQRFIDPNVRVRLLMRIGERQVAVGSIADAQKTFAVVAPELNQMQKEELARQQILARLFDDAFQTVSSIETLSHREYPGSLLLREQIRINRLNDAERTFALLPQGNTATECRSRLNIAQGTATRTDYNAFRLLFPEGNNQNWEPFCAGLMQQGFLRLAVQSAEGISDAQNRNDVRVRIAREYLLLYQAFNDVNDPNRSIRQEIQQTVVSLTNRIAQPLIQATILTELLMYHTGQLRTEADRAEGKRLWSPAMDACRNIAGLDEETVPHEKTVLFAQLIIAKNLLENPNLTRRTMPLFTRETNARAAAETNSLISECLAFINAQEDLAGRGFACAHLARASAQVARTTAAQILINDILQNVVPHLSHHETLISLFLSTIPALQAMGSVDAIPLMYRLAISEVTREFSGRTANVDEYVWRTRDSEIERIVRSQLENGFVDDAVESANTLIEPVYRERLFRTAAYIYLDHGDIDRAEMLVRRLTIREIRDRAVQNIQIIKRRSEIRPLTE